MIIPPKCNNAKTITNQHIYPVSSMQFLKRPYIEQNITVDLKNDKLRDVNM
jgi:hypothetical protein